MDLTAPLTNDFTQKFLKERNRVEPAPPSPPTPEIPEPTQPGSTWTPPEPDGSPNLGAIEIVATMADLESALQLIDKFRARGTLDSYSAGLAREELIDSLDARLDQAEGDYHRIQILEDFLNAKLIDMGKAQNIAEQLAQRTFEREESERQAELSEEAESDRLHAARFAVEDAEIESGFEIVKSYEDTLDRLENEKGDQP